MHYDLRRFSEIIERLYTPVAPSAFGAHVAQLLAQVVDAEIVTYENLDATRQAYDDQYVSVEIKDYAAWVVRCQELLFIDNPIAKHMAAGGEGGVLKISDFLSRRQWKQTGMYAEIFRPNGICEQMTVMIPCPGRVLGMTMNREKPFLEEDRTLVDLVAPHVFRAHANMTLMETIRRNTGAPAPTTLELRQPFGALTSSRSRGVEAEVKIAISHLWDQPGIPSVWEPGESGFGR